MQKKRQQGPEQIRRCMARIQHIQHLPGRFTIQVCSILCRREGVTWSNSTVGAGLRRRRGPRRRGRMRCEVDRCRWTRRRFRYRTPTRRGRRTGETTGGTRRRSRSGWGWTTTKGAAGGTGGVWGWICRGVAAGRVRGVDGLDPVPGIPTYGGGTPAGPSFH